MRSTQARLTDQDNENDEYHIDVSPVDTWAEYARLRNEEGWTQQQIAKAKENSDSTRMVYYRLKLHTLPNHIKEFCTQGLLTETHLREITEIELECNLSPWLTSEQAWEELATWAVGHTVAQQRIAEAKGLKSHVMVGYRLRLHDLPQHIKNFVNQDLLTETHLIEITSLSIDLHFSPWRSTLARVG